MDTGERRRTRGRRGSITNTSKMLELRKGSKSDTASAASIPAIPPPSYHPPHQQHHHHHGDAPGMGPGADMLTTPVDSPTVSRADRLAMGLDNPMAPKPVKHVSGSHGASAHGRRRRSSIDATSSMLVARAEMGADLLRAGLGADLLRASLGGPASGTTTAKPAVSVTPHKAPRAVDPRYGTTPADSPVISRADSLKHLNNPMAKHEPKPGPPAPAHKPARGRRGSAAGTLDLLMSRPMSTEPTGLDVAPIERADDVVMASQPRAAKHANLFTTPTDSPRMSRVDRLSQGLTNPMARHFPEPAHTKPKPKPKSKSKSKTKTSTRGRRASVEGTTAFIKVMTGVHRQFPVPGQPAARIPRDEEHVKTGRLHGPRAHVVRDLAAPTPADSPVISKTDHLARGFANPLSRRKL